jgi:tRNA (guanosine-2'-O-)-methyltransferase
VLLERVHKPHNLAAVVRTCDAVGVHELHAVPLPGSWKPAKSTSLGSERWLEIHCHDDVEQAAHSLKERGFLIYAAHLSNEASDFRASDYTLPCAVLFGAEKRGVSPTAAALADRHIVIPMLGMAASLNVSVAAGIILAEAQRQRLQAGFYETARLEAEPYHRTLVRWAHPVVAAHCERLGIPYPSLNDAGEIIDLEEWHQRLLTGESIATTRPVMH